MSRVKKAGRVVSPMHLRVVQAAQAYERSWKGGRGRRMRPEHLALWAMITCLRNRYPGADVPFLVTVLDKHPTEVEFFHPNGARARLRGIRWENGWPVISEEEQCRFAIQCLPSLGS